MPLAMCHVMYGEDYLHSYLVICHSIIEEFVNVEVSMGGLDV